VLLLVSGATATVRRHIDNPHLGLFASPRSRSSLGLIATTPKRFGVDNDAFTQFDPPAFRRLLARLSGHPRCLFVAAPDVVADAAATAERFLLWQPLIKAEGLPVALVLQDGQEKLGVPWDQVDALFVGGSTEFKLGSVAAGIAREAKARGLWLHFGRVNSNQRIRYAYETGADSVDGSGYSRWASEKITRALRCLDQLHRQGCLALAG
jgi:hypothetical protein